MNRDSTINLPESKIILKELEDELYRLVEFETWHHLAHTMQTWTLVAEDWVFTLLTCFPKGFLKFCTLAVCNIEHAL